MIANELLALANASLKAVWRSSWQATLLIVVVLLLQLVFNRKLSARWRYNLWLIVLVRLALPVMPSSRMSVYNFMTARPEPVARVVAPTAAVPVSVQATIVQTLPVARVPIVRPAHASVRSFDWRRWLPIAWLGGAALLAMRVLWATLSLRRSIKKLAPLTDPAILSILSGASRELNVSRPVELLSADLVRSPALTGIFRPRLLIPPSVLTNFDPSELRLIFLHELGHLRRNDVAANWLMTILLVIHWFNPILWLALARMRSDRELACDELVLSITRDNDRAVYGHTILKLLQSLARPAAVPGMVGILENPNPTRRRIAMIAAFNRTSRRWTVPVLLTMGAIGCVALTDSVKSKPATTADIPQATAAGPTTKPTDWSENDPTLVHLAQQDPAMRAMLKQRDDLDNEIQTMLVSYGKNHPSVANKQHQLELQNDKIEAYASDLRQTLARGRTTAPAQVPAVSRTPRSNATLTLNTAQPINLPRTPSRSEEQAQTIAQLERRVPEVNFKGTPLPDVIDFLRDVTGVNLTLNTRALEEAGIEKNAPVTLRLNNASLAQVLRQIGSVVGGNSTNLTYAIDNNALVFTTEEDASRYVITRAYNVDDLVSSATTQPGSAGTENARGDLCKVITDNITPDAWRDAGGTVGTISTFGNTLVISAPLTTHLDVDALLGELRNVRGNATAVFVPDGATGTLNFSGITLGRDAGPAATSAPALPSTTRPAGTR